MAKFLADESYPFAIQNKLRRLGHDVNHSRHFDQKKSEDGKSDAEILSIAASEDRIVITLNRKDFYALHHLGKIPGHPGIIACPLDRGNEDWQATQIDELVKRHKHLDGQFFVIEKRAKAKKQSRKNRG